MTWKYDRTYIKEKHASFHIFIEIHKRERERERGEMRLKIQCYHMKLGEREEGECVTYSFTHAHCIEPRNKL